MSYRSVDPSGSTTLQTSLLNNDVHTYVHLIKFEKPSVNTEVGYKQGSKPSRKANTYSYLTDGGFPVSFNDGSVPSDGSAENGAQDYIPGKVLSVGTVSETIEAKASTMSLTLAASALSASVTDTFTITSSTVAGTTDLLESGFSVGDTVEFSGSGANNGVYVRIDSFSNENKTFNYTTISGTVTTQSSVNYTLSFASEEIASLTASKEATDYSNYLNREVFIYRAHINPSTGALIGSPFLIFKGIITGSSFDDNVLNSAKVTWTLTSHWGDFVQVSGRITSDHAHRGLDVSGVPSEDAVIRPEYVGDLGFRHAEQAINVMATYQTAETRYKMKRKGGLSGLFGGKKLVEYTEMVDRDVDLEFNLGAKYIPVIYGVQKATGIPFFADGEVDEANKVYVAHAISEGPVHGILDLHIDSNPVICINGPDYADRNTGDNAPVLCVGRADRGDVLRGGASIDATTLIEDQIIEEAEQLVEAGVYADLETAVRMLTGGPRGYNSSTITHSDGGSGILHENKINLDSPLPTELTFHAGLSDQAADSLFTIKGVAKKFKVQSILYPDQPGSLYWGPAHQVLDTAYSTMNFTIGAGEFTIPDYEFIVKGRVLDCYNYDYSYSGSGTHTDFKLGDYVTLHKTDDDTQLGSENVQIIDKWSFYNSAGTLRYRFRFSKNLQLQDVRGDTAGDVKSFYMRSVANTSHKWYFSAYDNIVEDAQSTPEPIETQNFDDLSTITSGLTLQVITGNAGLQRGKISGLPINDPQFKASRGVIAFDIVYAGTLGTETFSLPYYTYTSSTGVILTTAQEVTQFRVLLAKLDIAQSYVAYAADAVKLNSNSSTTDDEYNNFELVITRIETSTGIVLQKETRTIVDYDGSNRIARLSSALPFRTDSTNAYKYTMSGEAQVSDGNDLFPSAQDKRVSINPAIQLLDYLTNKRYGKGLDIENDIDLASFLSVARSCDEQSKVTVMIQSGTAPTVGDKYKYPATGDIVFQGTVESTKQVTFNSSTFQEVTFKDVIGKLLYRWNDYRKYKPNEVLYYEGTAFTTNISSETGERINSTSRDSLISNNALNDSTNTFTLTKVGSASTTFDIFLNSADPYGTASTNPAIRRSSPTGFNRTGYSLYDSDDCVYWVYLGWDEPEQRYVTRHQTNLTVDTSQPVFNNINAMLEQFGGMLRYSNGKYALAIKTGAPADSHFDTDFTAKDISEDDIIGSVKVQDSGSRKTYNSLNATIVDPANKFGGRSITFMNSEYLKQDRGVKKQGNYNIPGISNYFNARMNIKQQLDESRYGLTVKFTLDQKGYLLLAGDIIRLTYSRFGWSNKYFRINSLNFQANGLVQVVADEHNNNAYIIDHLESSRGAQGLEGGGQGTFAPAVPSAPTSATAPSQDKAGQIELSWTNGTNFNSKIHRTQIARAPEANNVSAPNTDLSNVTIIAEVQTSTFLDSDHERTTNSGTGSNEALPTKYDYWVRHLYNTTGTTGTSNPLNKATTWLSLGEGHALPPTQTEISDGITIGSGGITMDTNPAGEPFIMGGMTDYNTGDGFYLGYDSNDYKFVVGSNTEGEKLVYDGTNLSLEGGQFTVTDSGGTAPSISGTTLAGAGILLKNDGDVLFGDSAGNYVFFDESEGDLTVKGDVTATSLTLTDGATVGNFNASSIEGVTQASFTSIGATAYSPAINGSRVTWTIPANDSGNNWNHKLVSDYGFIGGALVSFKINKDNTTNSRYMVGLSEHTTGTSYDNIDYAIFINSNTDVRAYENATNAQQLKSSVVAGDVCTITYDGTKVRYYINQSVVRTVDVSSAFSGPLYAHVALDNGAAASVEHRIDNLEFGAHASVKQQIQDSITVGSGGLTLDNTASIRGGQSGFDSGTGFFLGATTANSVVTHKFSIGNSSGNKLTFDGTDLAVTGEVTATSGTIGGINIDSTGIYTDNHTTFGSTGQGFFLGEDGTISVADGTDNIFRVNSDGDLTVVGDITANKLTLTAGLRSAGIDNVLINIPGKFSWTSTKSSPEQTLTRTGRNLSFSGNQNSTTWNNAYYVEESKHAGGNTLAFTVNTLTSRYMVGFENETSSDNLSNSFTTLDYAVFVRGNASEANRDYRIYEAGNLVQTLTDDVIQGDTWKLQWFGGTLYYLLNGVIKRETTPSAAAKQVNYMFAKIAIDGIGSQHTTLIDNVISIGQYTPDSITQEIENTVQITNGGITLADGGAIKGGLTGYNVDADNTDGSGFFLGYDTDAYKFSIGDEAGVANGQRLLWDGTDLSITGELNATSGAFTGEVSTSNKFIAGSGDDVAVMDGESSTYRFYAGAATPSDSAFSVDKDGKIIAQDITIYDENGQIILDVEGLHGIALAGISAASGAGVDEVSGRLDNNVDEITFTTTSANEQYNFSPKVQIDINQNGESGETPSTSNLFFTESSASNVNTLIGQVKLIVEYFVKTDGGSYPGSPTATEEFTFVSGTNATSSQIGVNTGATINSQAAGIVYADIGATEAIPDATISGARLYVKSSKTLTFATADTYKIKINARIAKTDGTTLTSSTTPKLIEPSFNGNYGVALGTGADQSSLEDFRRLYTITPASGNTNALIAEAADDSFRTTGGTSLLTTGGTISGDLTVTGNLTVSGSTTTVNTNDLTVADKEITLNYHATDDTSSSANGAGITIQDAVDANTDASILWNNSTTQFDFSHGISVAGGQLIRDANQGTNYLKLDDDTNSYGSNGVTLSSVSAMSFILDTNNNDSGSFTFFAHNSTPDTATQVAKITDDGSAVFDGTVTSDDGFVGRGGDSSTSGQLLNLHGTSLNQTHSGTIRLTEGHYASSPFFQGAYMTYDGANNAFRVGTHDQSNQTLSDDVEAFYISRGSANVFFQGRVLAISGTAAAPAYSFTGDTNTGLYRYTGGGEDRLGISTNGVLRANFGSHGIESSANVYSGTGASFRNYAGTWNASTGVTGNGFIFQNTADSTTALSLTADGDATFLGKIKSEGRQEYNDAYTVKVTKTYTGALDSLEYQKLLSIVPSGNSHNYEISGTITAQSAGSTQIIDLHLALRSQTLPDLVWEAFYDEKHHGSRFIDPLLWTKETSTAEFILAYQVLSGVTIYGTVTIDLIVRYRNSDDDSDITVSTASEQTVVDTGFTSNTIAKVKEVSDYDVTFPGAGIKLASSSIQRTTGSSNLNIWGGAGAGANIELYGDTHSTAANKAYYDASEHRFRHNTTSPTYLTLTSTQATFSTDLVVNSGTDDLVSQFISTDNKAGISIKDDTTTVYLSAENSVGSFGFNLGANANNLNINSAGNIGIGVGNPDHRIHMATAMSSTPTNIIYLEVTGSTNTDGGGGALRFDTSATNTNDSAFYASIEGIRSTSSDGSNELRFFTADANISGGTPTQKMVIDQTGAVGIATGSPTSGYKLHVNGNILANSATLGVDGGDRIKISNRATNDVAVESFAAELFLSSGYNGISFEGSANTTLMKMDDTGNFGIGTAAPGEKLEVVGNVEAEEFIGDIRGATLFKAQAGEALSKGDVVYISGISGNTTVVSKADADDAAKMPAFGIAAAAASANNPVDVYTSGILSGIDTSSYSEGDELFVSTTAGVLTNSAPAGESAALQKIGKVTRSHASSGSIFIIGAGRTNAVPNLNEGKLFVGNSSNQAVADNTMHVDIANSRVGIGTTSPVVPLHVNGFARFSDIQLTGTNPQVAAINNTSLVFKTNNTEVARFDASGNLGIGTTSPGKLLDVEGTARFGDSNFKITLDGTAAGGYFKIGTTSNDDSLAQFGAFGGSFELNTTQGNGFVFKHNAVERMRLTSGGLLGIGTTSPSEKLHVKDGRAKVENVGNATGTYAAEFVGTPTYQVPVSGGVYNHNQVSHGVLIKAGGTNVNNADSYPLRVQTFAGTDILIVEGRNERVGIGTTSPSQKLQVEGTTYSTTGFKVSNGYSIGALGANAAVRFNSGNILINNSSAAEYVRFDSTNSRVGIGTTSPNYDLDVSGTINSSSLYRIASRSAINWDNANTNLIVGPSVAGDTMSFRIGSNSSVMVIDSSSNIGIRTSSPTTKLTVADTTGGDALLITGNSGNEIARLQPVSGATNRGELLIKEGTANDTRIRLTTENNTSSFINTNSSFGIGTNAPSKKLHVAAVANNQLLIENIESSGPSRLTFKATSNRTASAWIQSTQRGTASDEVDIQIGDEGGTIATFNEGNVGIGTLSPTARLHIQDSNVGIVTNFGVGLIEATDAQLDIVSSSGGTWGSAINFVEGASTTANTNIWSIARQTTGGAGDSSLRFNFGTSNQHDNPGKVTFTSTGNVGIGYASPTNKLDVLGTISSTDIRLGSTASGEGIIRHNPGTGNSGIGITTGSLNSSGIKLFVEHTSDGGGVGIGTTSPAYLLHTEFTNTDTSLSGGSGGNWGSQGIRIENTSSGVGTMSLAHFRTNDSDWHVGAKRVGTNQADFIFAHEGSTEVTIDHTGKVGIGTTSPEAALHTIEHSRLDGAILQKSQYNITSANISTFNEYISHNGPIHTNGSTTNIDQYGYFRGYQAVYGNDGTNGYNPYAQGAYSNPVFEFVSNNRGTISLPTDSAIRNGYLYQFVLGNSGSGGTNGGVELTNSNTTLLWGITSSNDIHFTTNVGIGTDAPADPLHVVGDIRATARVLTGDGTVTKPSFQFVNSVNTGMYRPAADEIGFVNNASESMRIDADGKVGINVTDPLELLHINGGRVRIDFNGGHTSGNIGPSNAALDLYNNLQANTDEKGSVLVFSDNYYDGNNYIKTTRAAIKGGTDTTGNTADGFLAFYTDATGANSMAERMRIDHDGNVAIGNTSAGAKLDIRQDSGAAIRCENSSTAYFLVRADNSSYLTGDFGIGTQSPTARLHVVETGNATNGIIVHNGTNGTAARSNVRLTSDAAQFDIYATSSGYTGVSGWADAGVLSTSSNASGGLILNTQSGGMKFQYNTVTTMTLDSSRRVGINKDSSITGQLHVVSGSTNRYAAEFHGVNPGSPATNVSNGVLIRAGGVAGGLTDYALLIQAFNGTELFSVRGSDQKVHIHGAFALPTTDGQANQVLKTNGSGVVSWADDTSGATLSNGVDNRVVTASGANTLNGEANLTFDGSALNISGIVTASGRIHTSNSLYSADVGGVKFRQYQMTTTDAGGDFLLGKIQHSSGADGAVEGIVHFTYDYGTTTNQCTLHFSFAQRQGAARGSWWYEHDDQDTAADRVHVRLIDDGSGNIFVWVTCTDFAVIAVETWWRQGSQQASSGSLSSGTLTTGTTLFDTANDPTAEFHIGKLYAHDDVSVTGALSATTKSFDIEHPTKEGMRLHHGSLEGPEHGVYVRGHATENVIELPEYWTGLVDEKSITVQLTANGRFQKLYVEKVENNKVYLRNASWFSNKIDCYYMINATRKDIAQFEVEYGNA